MRYLMVTRLVIALVFLACFFGSYGLVQAWAKIGARNQAADVVTPYDYSYPERETYVSGLREHRHVLSDRKGRLTTRTSTEVIYSTRETGRTLHETRYNHTAPFPYTREQGVMVGATGCIPLAMACLWAVILMLDALQRQEQARLEFCEEE